MTPANYKQGYTIYPANDYLGRDLVVLDPSVTLPRDLLPARVSVESTFGGQPRCRRWYAVSETGAPIALLSLPHLVGDGSRDLAQLEAFLVRHGYVRDDSDLPRILYNLSPGKA